MKLIVKPSELIHRFIWNNYEHYCLNKKSKTEILKIIEEDKEFELSEKDAFAINFTNVLYTNLVIYKFKMFILGELTNKVIIYNNYHYISKEILLMCLRTFKKNIPKSFVSDDFIFQKNWNEMETVFQIFKNLIDELVIQNILNIQHIKAAQVKKIVMFRLEKRLEYHYKHNKCPNCKSLNIKTENNSKFKESKKFQIFKNDNQCECLDCNWKGIVDHLI